MYYIYIYIYIYIHIHTHILVQLLYTATAKGGAAAGAAAAGVFWGFSGVAAAVDFRNFIVFFVGRDPGTLKSDIVSKKHPQSISSDLRLSN